MPNYDNFIDNLILVMGIFGLQSFFNLKINIFHIEAAEYDFSFPTCFQKVSS